MRELSMSTIPPLQWVNTTERLGDAGDPEILGQFI
jgi:hypothetical protein